LEPTRAAKYSVIEATEWSVTLELKSEGAWCDDLKDDKGVELKVTKVDSGAGEVIFEKPIVVATVVKEPDGDICDDSCEWALDGVCDDGTQPNIVDDEYGWDDDWGGRYGDDHYYAGFYDDAYGQYWDDEGSLPACAYGTDCTDCQPLHGDATKKEQEPVECDNTCAYARDGFCDDPRQGGECALGTDCQDCGPASKGNFSTYEDDTWWDDDESNWSELGVPYGAFIRCDSCPSHDDVGRFFFEFDGSVRAGTGTTTTLRTATTKGGISRTGTTTRRRRRRPSGM
jgi:hypothetical protein